ncbi:MAG: family 43 glycosylhydrolase [Chloroflexi bacterium]|nr:family 43 glycosylhydrolase [Chloroflexota bacterium]
MFEDDHIARKRNTNPWAMVIALGFLILTVIACIALRAQFGETTERAVTSSTTSNRTPEQTTIVETPDSLTGSVPVSEATSASLAPTATTVRTVEEDAVEPETEAKSEPEGGFPSRLEYNDWYPDDTIEENVNRETTSAVPLPAVTMTVKEDAGDSQTEAQASSGIPSRLECSGWHPDNVKLKENAIFRHGNRYWLLAQIAEWDDTRKLDLHEWDKARYFFIASSSDACRWHLEGTILDSDPAHEERFVWSPYVIAEGDFWYLFYTRATSIFGQSIFLATSDDPGDTSSWMDQGVIFQPSHPDIIWLGGDHWSDCRDPMVLKVDDTYYMYYTASCLEGGCIAVATSSTLMGPWEDEGPTYVMATGMPESPFVLEREGVYYLFFNNRGEQYATAADPRGPWQDRGILKVEGEKRTEVWANEFLQVEEGWITSFLTTYSISVRWLRWNENVSPPEPIIIGPVIRRSYITNMMPGD